MQTYIPIVLALLVGLQCVLIYLCFSLRQNQEGADQNGWRAAHENLEKALGRVEVQFKADMAANRTEAATLAQAGREEQHKVVQGLGEFLRTGQESAAKTQAEKLTDFSTSLAALATATQSRLDKVRDTLEEQLKLLGAGNAEQWEKKRASDALELKQTRAELNQALQTLADSITTNVAAMAEVQRTNLETITGRVDKLTEGTEKRLAELRETVEARLKALQEANALKLDEMRATVDEKLQGTLEKRLGESFTLVSERLEQVHRGLGEMQTLASGVGDLKRVLTNVKTRGTWGEIQLGSLLEQILSPSQFARNVCPIPGKNEVVEFAIKLPGREEGQEQLWLPIDAKYPNEEYERLVLAQEAADAVAVEAAGKLLEAQMKRCARDIAAKYVAPPHTTDFAILFLPTEGLYAEIIRRTELVQALQRDHRVTIAGPTTLTAILSSLQMGFRTLAIQQRSSEVWKVLGQAKTEFGRYGDMLDKVSKKLTEAQNTVDQAAVRSRAIERSLKDVEALPSTEVLPLAEAAAEENPVPQLELAPEPN